MLDLESWGLGSIPTKGNILSLEFFYFHKDENATIGIFVQFLKNSSGSVGLVLYS